MEINYRCQGPDSLSTGVEKYQLPYEHITKPTLDTPQTPLNYSGVSVFPGLNITLSQNN